MQRHDLLIALLRDYIRQTKNRPPVNIIFDDTTASVLSDLISDSAPEQVLGFYPRGKLYANARLGDVGQEWIAFSFKNETAIRKQVESYAPFYPKIKLISVIKDLLVDFLGHDFAAADPVPHDARILDLPMYAITCTPRSGSTYLGELLTSVGLGKPEEHLRERQAKYLSGLSLSKDDSFSALNEFVWRHQRNFIFGTKLISHFLFDLAMRASLDEGVVGFLKDHAKILYILRADKVSQAVSDFLANKTQVWHVRDRAARSNLQLAHEGVEYDFDELLNRFNFVIKQEEKLVEFVLNTNHVGLRYEDIIRFPRETVDAISSFLGFSDIGTPSATLLSSHTPVSDEIRNRFVFDYKARFGTHPPSFVPEQVCWAKDFSTDFGEPQSLRQLQALRFGQYQKRSWHIVDYRCRFAEEIGEWIRADQSEPEEDEPFVVALGSAHTFGPYVQRPFVNILSEELELPFINYGVGGAGPDFYARAEVRSRLFPILNEASAVIFQVQSCRTMGSAVLPKGSDPKNSLIVSHGDQSWQFDSERALVELRKLGRDSDLKKHIDLAREAWCRLMIELAQTIKPPKILFWFSNRIPEYTEGWPLSPGIDWLLGGFPQLINKNMMDSVRPHFDEYVEVVCQLETEGLMNRFTHRPTKAVFGGGLPVDQHWEDLNSYYPTSTMHIAAAAALAPVLERIRAIAVDKSVRVNKGACSV